MAESDAERALTACGSLISLAPCAVVLPDTLVGAGSPLQVSELDYYGVGVVAWSDTSGARVIVPPEDRSGEFGPSLYGRWLQEVLYDRILRGRYLSEVPREDIANSSESSE
jgi:hypothetical protein